MWDRRARGQKRDRARRQDVLELYLYGNQIGTYTGISSSGNGNGVRVNLTGVEPLGSESDVYRIVVTQVSPGQSDFLNGQQVAIYTWPDNQLVTSGLNPKHDEFSGRASSGTHQIFTDQRYVIDLDGITGTTLRYGPGANPPLSETLPFSALLQEPPFVPCFAAGTRISCPGGTRPVEDLRPGDLVRTRDHGDRPVVWSGAARTVGTGVFTPVRFAPGAIGNVRALFLSPQHRVLLSGWRVKLLFGEDDVLVAAKDLVDGFRVTREERAVVTYVHLLLATHEILEAEGAPAESLHLGPYIAGQLAAPDQAEIRALFPGLGGAGPHGPRTARRCLRSWEARLLVRPATAEAATA
jgi:hypothetical protein